jgi:hypothetical protein
MVRPKAWVVLRSITNAKLERHLLLRCDWIAEKNRTRSGEAGRGVLNTSNRKPPLSSVSPATDTRLSAHAAVFRA